MLARSSIWWECHNTILVIGRNGAYCAICVMIFIDVWIVPYCRNFHVWLEAWMKCVCVCVCDVWMWLKWSSVFTQILKLASQAVSLSVPHLPFHSLSPVLPGRETSRSFEISPRNAEMCSHNISVTFLCRELKAEGQAQVHISPAWRTHSLQVSTASISTSRNNNWNYHPLRRIYCSVLNTCCTCP